MQMLELSTGYFAWAFRFILTAIDCLIFKYFLKLSKKGPRMFLKKGHIFYMAIIPVFLMGRRLLLACHEGRCFRSFICLRAVFFQAVYKESSIKESCQDGKVYPF
jgi:hypothetical protein